VSTEPETNIVTLISQVWNWTILGLYFIAIIIAIILVGRDARERGYGWPSTAGWCALVIFVFPVGLALYLVMVKKDFSRRGAG
jgi:hypothetical protein